MGRALDAARRRDARRRHPLLFEAALGERCLCSGSRGEDERVRKRARYAIDRADVGRLREQAQTLAAALVDHARRRVPRQLSEESAASIVDVAFLAAHARTGVQFEEPAATGFRLAIRRRRSRPDSPADEPAGSLPDRARHRRAACRPNRDPGGPRLDPARTPQGARHVAARRPPPSRRRCVRSAAATAGRRNGS